MLSVNSKINHLPVYSSGPIQTEETGLNYLNQVRDFFVNILGFFVVITLPKQPKIITDPSDLSKQGWCYFFSDKKNGYPIFCIHTLVSSDISTRYQRLILESCGSDGADWFPLYSPISSEKIEPNVGGYQEDLWNAGAVFTTLKQPCAINFCINIGVNNSQHNNYKDMHYVDIVVQDVKFEDGRRIIFFKSFNKVTKEWIGSHNWCALFYTDIYFKNNQIRDWVILNTAFSSSYNKDYEQHIVNKNLAKGTSNFVNLQRIMGINPGAREEQMRPYSSSSVTGGLIPGIYGDKDYLINQNFYIGDEAYIPNVYRYSNIRSMEISENKMNFILTNLGKMGDYITIKNNNYLVIYNGFLFPFTSDNNDDKDKDWRFYGYDTSTIGKGCYENTILGTGNYFRTINTESLLILI